MPTRYVAAGGQLPPLVLERRDGVDCSAPSECAITGLTARPSRVTTAEHGVARPVVIFVHGYGGSRIACGNKPLWFSVLSGNLGLVGPDLWDMRLGRDGNGLKRADGGTECSETAGVSGLLRDVAGGDIYGGASDHFKEIAWPGRAYDYVWDWRKSPEVAAQGLDALVEKARCGGEPPCDSKVVRRVSLVGHSMGGLVIRHYIEDDARADKVQRVVTVGTPYWGSPKAIFPVAAGVEVPMFSEMDILLDNGGLKAAARSFPGHFALMPAFGYGPWLSVSGAQASVNGGRPLDVDGVEEYLRRIGADPMLYTRGASEHGRVLDHFRDHDIDYHVIVGGGLPSIGAVGLKYNIGGQQASIRWVSGDETVPAFSGAHDTPRDRLHYVCGISHVPLTTDPQTTRLMDDFVIRGEPMRDEQSECPYDAREITTYDRQLSALASAGPKEAQVVAGGKTYSLEQAEQAKLVQVVRLGGQSTIVAMAGSDVQVRLPAGATARIRDLDEKGAGKPRTYGPFPASGGAVALGGSGAVSAGGKALKPVKADTRAPKTTARVQAAARRQAPPDAEGARRVEGRRHLRDGGRQAHHLPQAAGRDGQAAGQAPLRLRGPVGERGSRTEGAAPAALATARRPGLLEWPRAAALRPRRCPARARRRRRTPRARSARRPRTARGAAAAASSAPASGATMNSHSCSSAQPPTNSAGPDAARRVHRQVGDRDADEVDQREDEPDRDAGERDRGDPVGRREDGEDEEGGEHDLGDERRARRRSPRASGRRSRWRRGPRRRRRSRRRGPWRSRAAARRPRSRRPPAPPSSWAASGRAILRATSSPSVTAGLM